MNENSNVEEKPETAVCERCLKEFPKDDMKKATEEARARAYCRDCVKTLKAEAEKKRIAALPRGYFKLKDSKKLKALFKVLECLCDDEVTFTLSQNDLKCRMMDVSRIAMTDLKLERPDFEEFECAVPGKFALNVKDMVERVFKNLYKDESVTFTIGYDKANMRLSSRLNRTFAIKPLDPNMEEIPDPKIKYTVHAKLVTDAVRDALKDFRDGGWMKVLTNMEGITLEEGGDDVEMPVTVPLLKGSDALLEIEIQAGAFRDPVKAVYSNTYLKALLNSICTNGTDRLADIIVFEYAADMPMKVTPIIQGVSMSFWLAPRIQNDD